MAVIATPASTAAPLAGKAATATIPFVRGDSDMRRKKREPDADEPDYEPGPQGRSVLETICSASPSGAASEGANAASAFARCGHVVAHALVSDGPMRESAPFRAYRRPTGAADR